MVNTYSIRAKKFTWYGEPIEGYPKTEQSSRDYHVLEEAFTWTGSRTELALSLSMNANGELQVVHPSITDTGLQVVKSIEAPCFNTGNFRLAVAPNSQIVTTAPSSDQVLIYDLDDPPLHPRSVD